MSLLYKTAFLRGIWRYFLRVSRIILWIFSIGTKLTKRLFREFLLLHTYISSAKGICLGCAKGVICEVG
jgi:hypothetical protein